LTEGQSSIRPDRVDLHLPLIRVASLPATPDSRAPPCLC
jgi:hypothetical protein